MKAVVVHRARDLRVDDRPVPEPGEGEVRLTMTHGGICGSDLHYYLDGRVGNCTVEQDQRATLGFKTHEIVEWVGLGVQHVGDRRGTGFIESRASANSEAMAAGNCPHATVLLGRIVDGKPETDCTLWFGP